MQARHDTEEMRDGDTGGRLLKGRSLKYLYDNKSRLIPYVSITY